MNFWIFLNFYFKSKTLYNLVIQWRKALLSSYSTDGLFSGSLFKQFFVKLKSSNGRSFGILGMSFPVPISIINWKMLSHCIWNHGLFWLTTSTSIHPNDHISDLNGVLLLPRITSGDIQGIVPFVLEVLKSGSLVLQAQPKSINLT